MKEKYKNKLGLSYAEAGVGLLLVWNQKLDITSYITSLKFERIIWISKSLIFYETVGL